GTGRRATRGRRAAAPAGAPARFAASQRRGCGSGRTRCARTSPGIAPHAPTETPTARSWLRPSRAERWRDRSGGEGRAAAAGMGGVGVHELEPASVQTAHVVDLESLQVRGAGGVDAHLDPVVLDYLIAFLGLVVEVELVAEA